MLAEQPPNDMAALLSMFHHVNPVLRRRFKELFDTIRNAGQETISTPVAEVVGVATPEDRSDAMQEDIVAPAVQISHQAGKLPGRLWPTGMSSEFDSTVSFSRVASVSSRGTKFSTTIIFVVWCFSPGTKGDGSQSICSFRKRIVRRHRTCPFGA